MTVSGVSVAAGPLTRFATGSASQSTLSTSRPFNLNDFVRSTGIPGDSAQNFLTSATRLSVASMSGSGVVSSATALSSAKVPMTSDGLPDFDAIVAAGGHVQGAIPPDGSTMIQNVTQNGNVIEYAAVIDMGDGSAPFLLKGGDMQSATGTSRGDREQLLATLKSVLADLPRSLDQARVWAAANGWSPYTAKDNTAPTLRLDASL